jgi:hypothetical protein
MDILTAGNNIKSQSSSYIEAELIEDNLGVEKDL